jgi:hypothetical protein
MGLDLEPSDESDVAEKRNTQTATTLHHITRNDPTPNKHPRPIIVIQICCAHYSFSDKPPQSICFQIFNAAHCTVSGRQRVTVADLQ